MNAKLPFWASSGLLVLAIAVAVPFTSATAADKAPAPAKPAAKKLEYNRDIRPILAENCFACHGPDSAARKAKLRLDLREEAMEMKAVVPGKPTESEMIRRILAEDDDKDLMPPKKTNKKLKPEQKELLKKWIAAGAEYQAHWSFIAPTRPKVP
ncbi:MAG TPA: c-type cytochrome domain-containing protein, partial [Gemmataceae bacterium]